jgi:hypothetical protein
MTGPSGTPPELTTLLDVPLGWGVFAFVAISALALFIIPSPGVFGWYKLNLLRDRNYGRWSPSTCCRCLPPAPTSRTSTT